MKIVTIDADGDTLITEGSQDSGRIQRQKGKTTVVISKNIDGATVTFGTVDSDGTFVSFPDGTITDGSVINHGAGCDLYVQVSGITANSVEIKVSN
jgi:hypothetical protein